jgi:hypothetical protein
VEDARDAGRGSAVARVRSRYQHGLQTAVGASAGPYGFTLTIWTSGAVLIHQRGLPSSRDALLFMGGSVVAFAAIGALAFVRGTLESERTPRHPVLWGSFHFIPIGASIAAVGLLGDAGLGEEVWPLAGLVATAIYLLLVGAQIAVFSQPAPVAVERLRERSRELVAETESLARRAEEEVRSPIEGSQHAKRPGDGSG